MSFTERLKQPEVLLYLFAAAIPLSFATWRTLINNFAIEQANFSGIEMGTLQSIREIPGFLAFGVIFLLIIFREQTLASLSILILGIGTALTGLMPTVMGLYFTTVLMSLGFHYAETVQQSLSLQLIDKNRLPYVLGKQISIGSFIGLCIFGSLYVLIELFNIGYQWIYLIFGGLTCIFAVGIFFFFPHFKGEVTQHKKMILRKKYWLYYLLTFFSGARRQIFVVFAGFLMVEKFDFSAADMSLLFLINASITIFLAPKIGLLVQRLGERKILTLEYVGLMIIFASYAIVDNELLASIIYILDHIFFAMAIALKSYFKKIADPADMAATAGVAFSINHIAAVVLPVALGFVWVYSTAIVFLIGVLFALGSLLLSQLIPLEPQQGFETTLVKN